MQCRERRDREGEEAVVKYFLHFLHSQGTKLWIIMEYLGGGSALDLVSLMWCLCLTPVFSPAKIEGVGEKHVLGGASVNIKLRFWLHPIPLQRQSSTEGIGAPYPLSNAGVNTEPIITTSRPNSRRYTFNKNILAVTYLWPF